MLTPSDTASRIAAAIHRKAPLTAAQYESVVIEVANGIEADRHALAKDIAETATALLPAPAPERTGPSTPGTPGGPF